MRKPAKRKVDGKVGGLWHGLMQLEALEDRTVPAGIEPHLEAWELAENYSPPQQHLVNIDGFLTAPRQGDPVNIAIEFLRDSAATLGLSPKDVTRYVVTDLYTDQDWVSTTHIYLRQTFNGLTVNNANININVTRDGRVLNLGSTFYGGLSAWETYPEITPSPHLTATRAVELAAAQLGYNLTAAPFVSAETGALDQLQELYAPGASLDPVVAHLAYTATPEGAFLTWKFALRTPDGDHWYDVYADAVTGKIRYLADWVDHASYQVYPWPLESPSEGGRQIVVDPWNAVASPYGWHDTNGAAGAEFTDTRGNNVYAQEDADANNTGGFRPDGGASLDFQFPLDLTQAPSTYVSAAITNLFYWNNVLHDIHYQYGFTPAAGNFQVNNYGLGGVGNDPVQADAQDGSGTNNANFATPPDGSVPRMQQYIFTYTTPNRDSSLDNGIIIHEYGHGVSNRLTGGPSNSNALNATQSGGMGEGWSDFFALMLTQRPTDLQNSAYPMGTYAIGQSPSGSGIRRQPYSYNMSINTQTIGWFNASQQVHNAGELWCTVLWDLNWILINKHGYDGDLYTGYAPGGGPASAGNKLALRLVLDGMKLQPSLPSFLDARNAIFAADQALTGGANKAEIWQAFARRGMGVGFLTTSSSSTSVVESFAVPTGLPTLSPNNPLGSLAYEGSAIGALVVAGAVDSHVLSLQAGQTLSVVVTPAVSSLRPVVELRDPANVQIAASTATSAGSVALIQSAPLSTAGSYTINVSGFGTTTGGYTARVILNGAVESEFFLGTGNNNSTAAAQNVDSAFSTIQGSSQVATIYGNSDLGGSLPNEVESNNTTATANSINGNFNPVNINLYHMGISGGIGSGSDVDWFNIGQLQAGDVITISQSGSPSSRGTNADPFVDLYRGGSLGSPVASDDDNGPGADSLIYRFTITVTDTYYVRARKYATTNTGTYQLAVYLENSGPPPNTGGSLISESEPNDSAATANDASSSWRPVQYLSRTYGTATSSDVDMYSATFAAGDLVSVYVRSLSALDARVSILNSSGTAIAVEDGSSGTGNDSPIYAYRIPSAGTYYFNVRQRQGTSATGAYYIDVMLSTDSAPSTPTPVPDHYAFTLTAGEWFSMGMLNASGAAISLDLLNSGGSVVASAATSTGNYSHYLANYQVPSTGTYYARISGEGLADYSLVLTRNAGLDLEPNNSFATGVDASGVPGVLGYRSDDDYYRVSLTAGQAITLQTFTPGDGVGQFANGFNPLIQLLDPAGGLIASDDNSAPDGRNALLTAVATTTGSYGIRITGVGGSTGEYYLSIGISTGDVVAPTIVGVYFNGSAWDPLFRAAAGHPTYGYPAQSGAGQLTSLPWSTIDTVHFVFSEDVNVSSANLGVRGLNIATYTPTLASYDSVNFVASFTIPTPFATDRILLDLDGSASGVTDLAGNPLAGSWNEGVSTFPTSGSPGTNFQYRFVVAVGDADRNGLVRNADVNLVRANLFLDVGSAGYNIFVDVDGNGLVRNADVNTVRARLFLDPPSGPGPFRPIRGGQAAGKSELEFRTSRITPASAAILREASTVRRLAVQMPAAELDELFAEF